MDLEGDPGGHRDTSRGQQRALAKWLRQLSCASARVRTRRQMPGAARQVGFESERRFRTRSLLWTVASLLLFLLVEGASFPPRLVQQIP